MNNFISLIENNLINEDGLNFIEQEIKLLFNVISKTKCIEDAELLFNNLEDIQYILAKAVFKNGLKVTPFLRDFVYNFDRIDDCNVKRDLYQKIKSTIW